MGAPKCLRAKGCTSRSSHLCRAAIMSQVSTGGGDRAICGLLPMLTSCMGAGVPHSAPSRIGGSGRAMRSRPLSMAVQRARASSISCLDHSAGAWACGVLASGRVLGQTPWYLAAGGGNLPASAAGSCCCAWEIGVVASTQSTAAAAQRITYIREVPPTVRPEIPARRPSRIRIWNWLTRQSYIAQNYGARESPEVGGSRNRNNLWKATA